MRPNHLPPPSAWTAVSRAALLTAALCLLLPPAAAGEVTLPPGFTETRVATGLERPTAMAFAPDGRIFVCEQDGALKVVKDGEVLAEPFVTLPVDSLGERGLVGVTVDPGFEENGWVYVYYTATTPKAHNRLVRFTAGGDRALPGSEVAILELPNLARARIHNGGALHFGSDGKLYVAVGENANPTAAQRLDTVFGKILRINPDGTPPPDNPFFGATEGLNRAIFAMGLRNPFTFAFQPGTGRMYVNDVGQSTWEEVNEVTPGANFGWPETEGPTDNPAFRTPVFAYVHGPADDQGCAITGGAFYDPAQPQFPREYVGGYFFSDFCRGFIRRLDPVRRTVTDFALGADKPVDLRVTGDGSLYYLDRGSGSIFRIHFTASQAPRVTRQPESVVASVGESVTFAVSASGLAPLRYRWQRDGVNIPGATAAAYALPAVALSDDRAVFRAVVSNGFGSATSEEARLTVTADGRPAAAITAPAAGALYRAGETMAFAGMGTDPELGDLPASAFTWRVDFHHDSHVHPFVPPTSGVKAGSFTIPVEGETSANVFYRVVLTVRDPAGLAHTATADVLPRKATLTLASDPPGLQVTLDGQPLRTPATVVGVVGTVRRLGVASPQVDGGVTYDFASWSDGGAAEHEIATPEADTTYTAGFLVRSGLGRGIGLAATYFDNPDLAGPPAWTRVDRGVNLATRQSPAPGVRRDHFSVRWMGQVEPVIGGLHTFTVRADDGVRLWVDRRLLIDAWEGRGLTEVSGEIELPAGRRYDLRMEFRDDVGAAQARLLWQAPRLPRQVVPASQLYPYLLLVRGGGTVGAGDLAVEAHLTEAGWAVSSLPATGITPEEADGAAAVLVSASAPVWMVRILFHDAAVPLMIWGARGFDELGMTGTRLGVDQGLVVAQDRVRVVAAGDPRAGGLAGPRQVTTATLSFGWGLPGPGAEVIARLCRGVRCADGGQAAIFTYDRDAEMAGGLEAPSRRVGLFAGAGAPALFTADGWALFDAALAWASGR